LSGSGQGINRLGGGFNDAPEGESDVSLLGFFHALAARLRRVRVCCGDWTRILGPSPTIHIGTTAVLLDPPYSGETGRATCYSQDDMSVAHAVRAWCLEHGDEPNLRIALCGYDGEHNDLEAHGWTVHAWKAQGGYSNARQDGKPNENAARERIWFSPHCLDPAVADRQQTIEGLV
jgi:DNA adenine methylase